MGLIITSRVLKALRQSQGANFYLEWEPLTNPLRCQFSSLFSFNFICLFLAVLGLRCCLQAFSSYSGGVGYSCSCEQLFIAAASLVAENGLKAPGLQELWCTSLVAPRMWDLPRPGIKPMSPALAVRFYHWTTVSPFSLKVQLQATSLLLFLKESGAKSLTPPKVVFNLKIDYLIIDI